MHWDLYYRATGPEGVAEDPSLKYKNENLNVVEYCSGRRGRSKTEFSDITRLLGWKEGNCSVRGGV